MDRRKRQSPNGKYRRKRSGLAVWTLPLLVCAFLLITGGVLAKYVTSNRQRSEMESSQFHISSNYLEEDNDASYTVADWGNGFDILLFNYEKENIAQISGVDMTYQITVNDASVRVTNQDGSELAKDSSGSYRFDTATATAHHTLHVTLDANADVGTDGKTITVTVETTSPYRKTLQAKFNIQRNSQPDYTVKDQGDGTVLITVRTNDYSNDMLVIWDPDKLSPDNTNALMTNWKDESPTGTFHVSRDSTYELLFFKNTDADFSGQEGIGTRITLN